PYSRRGADRHPALSALLRSPGAVGVEVLQRESDRVHQLVAACTGFIFAVQRHLLPQSHHLFFAITVFKRWHVRRRLRRWCTEDIFEYPHTALHGRRTEVLLPG